LVRNIIGIPTASARRKSYYHARQTTRSQQHVSSRDETRRDETRRDGTRRKRVTVSTIFHVAENFPRRKGNTLSLSRRRGGTVLLKVRNKSQPSREREREEWGGRGRGAEELEPTRSGKGSSGGQESARQVGEKESSSVDRRSRADNLTRHPLGNRFKPFKFGAPQAEKSGGSSRSIDIYACI